MTKFCCHHLISRIMSFSHHIYLFLLFFYWKNKTIFIHSNWWSTSDTNIAKNVKGGYANKVTTPKLIAYNNKMLTNNIIKSKSLKYPCLRICNVYAQIIDWICNWLMSIFQQELNEHHDKARNWTPHKTTDNTKPQLDDEITKDTRKNYICENHLFWLKGKGKKM